MEELVPQRPTALSTIWGVSAPVPRRTYALVGFGLMTLKYAIDSALLWMAQGVVLSPLAYLTPLVSIRLHGLETLSPAILLGLVLWTLPFVWVGSSMSVRRARDAGLPGILGLLFFMPVINYLMMLVLCALPSRSPKALGLPFEGDDRVVWASMVGVASGAAMALGMLGLSVFVLGQYGAALFVGTPFVMGTVSALLLNLRGDRGLVPNISVGLVTVGVSGGLMMLFALEGAICLAMASPIAVALSLLGVVLGRALAGIEQQRALVGPLAFLPIIAVVEPTPAPPALHRVTSTIDIAAPPEVVWDHVAGFGEITLPDAPAWFFQLGIAYPVRARIEGTGLGATRYCEFSTGAFVEPITTWDPPNVLAFDVLESPPTMHEWSPYEKVHAPHLDGILLSQRGEFRLFPLPDGGTRLEGTTWYTFEMAPEAYWTLWSDALIGAIHNRVLRHVAGLAEATHTPAG